MSHTINSKASMKWDNKRYLDQIKYDEMRKCDNCKKEFGVDLKHHAGWLCNKCEELKKQGKKVTEFKHQKPKKPRTYFDKYLMGVL